MQHTNRLRFDFDKDAIPKESDKLIADAKKVLDEVSAIPPEKRTFKSVVLPLADSESELSTLSNNVTFPSYVHVDKAVRDASSAAQEKIEAFEIESGMREDVYAALKTVKDTQYSSLKDDEKRLLDRMLRDFERNGLALDTDKRAKVKDLKTRLSKIQIDFQKNVSEDKTELLFSQDELQGLPQDFIDSLRKDDVSDKRIASLKYPELFPILKYCKVESTRKAMEFANSAKCLKANTPLFEDALVIRQEIAELLGFKNYAQYVLDVRMAKTPEAVVDFLTNLKDRLTPGAKQELDVLIQLKKKQQGNDAEAVMNAWDVNYYQTLLKETQYQVDDNFIKDYFPAEYVIQAMLDIVQETFGLKFAQVPNAPVWHEEVKLYNVFDADSSEFLGQFYSDLHPRDGKYSHAAAFPLQCHHIHSGDGSVQHPVSAMVCNFTKSTSTKPSLLKHDEVVTLFHEFGHLCHGFLSKAKYGRFSGTSVERDFVECPSQFMENYCWDKVALKRLSKHYQTGEPLSDQVIEKMIAAKNCNIALLTLRQLFFGIFDMTCHTTKPPIKSAELYGKLKLEVSLIPNTEGTNGAASFAHLLGGYESGYYGYLWSQVFSADVFGVFKDAGIFNSSIGKHYRNTVLHTGGMLDGDVILRNFLGRAPSNDAFMKSIGL